MEEDRGKKRWRSQCDIYGNMVAINHPSFFRLILTTSNCHSHQFDAYIR